MFGELEPLGLIVGADPIAVKRAGLLQHLLVDQTSDDLFIRDSHQRPRKILITVENDFCNKICHEQTIRR
jgi:hypothetical protein